MNNHQEATPRDKNMIDTLISSLINLDSGVGFGSSFKIELINKLPTNITSLLHTELDNYLDQLAILEEKLDIQRPVSEEMIHSFISSQLFRLLTVAEFQTGQEVDSFNTELVNLWRDPVSLGFGNQITSAGTINPAYIRSNLDNSSYKIKTIGVPVFNKLDRRTRKKLLLLPKSIQKLAISINNIKEENIRHQPSSLPALFESSQKIQIPDELGLDLILPNNLQSFSVANIFRGIYSTTKSAEIRQIIDPNLSDSEQEKIINLLNSPKFRTNVRYLRFTQEEISTLAQQILKDDVFRETLKKITPSQSQGGRSSIPQ